MPNNIEVNPEQLRQTADQLENRARNIQKHVDETEQIIMRTIIAELLRGQLGEALVDGFRLHQSKMGDWQQVLIQFANALRQIADVFEQADKGGFGGDGGSGGGAPPNGFGNFEPKNDCEEKLSTSIGNLMKRYGEESEHGEFQPASWMIESCQGGDDSQLKGFEDGGLNGAVDGDILFINGINTSHEGHLDAMLGVSHFSGGKSVTGLYNATDGFFGDLGQSLDDAIDANTGERIQTNQAVNAAIDWIKNKDYQGEIVVHSQGSLVLAAALTELERQGADLSGLKVTTFGGAGQRFPEGDLAPQYHHYMHTGDEVPTIARTVAQFTGRVADYSPIERFAKTVVPPLMMADLAASAVPPPNTTWLAVQDTNITGDGFPFMEDHDLFAYLENYDTFQAQEQKSGVEQMAQLTWETTKQSAEQAVERMINPLWFL